MAWKPTASRIFAADMGDALAAEVDEMLRGDFAHLYIVGTDEVSGQVREVAIEEEVGCASVAELVKVAKVDLAGSDDEDIDATA